MMKKQIFLLLFIMSYTSLPAKPDTEKQSTRDSARSVLLTASSSQLSTPDSTKLSEPNKCHKIIHTELASSATCATIGLGIWTLGAHRESPRLKTIGAFAITIGIIGSHIIGTAAFLALSKK